MSIRLTNSLTRVKEDFVPLDPANVRMYVCGPTVYDFAHIGNARPAIVFDVLFRLLRRDYGAAHVTYVRNITDVDDKINARAAEVAAARAIGVEQARAELTEATERQYLEDVAALGCLAPTHSPRATAHIGEMIALVEKLIAGGHAYVAPSSDGEGSHVLFDVGSDGDYGKLSRRNLDEMIAGARVEVAPYKKDAMDFVLWKPSEADAPGWDSPWGRGRPGWHLECSAMAGKYLGRTFDIHCGGIDLMFPHHENEIAQSECANHAPYVKMWLHNGFLQVEGEKMSKSAGNFFTIRQLLADWPGEVLRFNMLRTHYRQPIDFTFAGLRESWKMLERWYGVTEPLADPAPDADFLEALRDDLNTPAAIAALHRAGDDALAGGLGFLGFSNVQMKIAATAAVDTAAIAEAIAARAAARKAKNFAESDRIRDALLARNIILKDGPDGTTWEVKK
jgi:cysteinyl-tRNA synthetase